MKELDIRGLQKILDETGIDEILELRGRVTINTAEGHLFNYEGYLSIEPFFNGPGKDEQYTLNCNGANFHFTLEEKPKIDYQEGLDGKRDYYRTSLVFPTKFPSYGQIRIDKMSDIKY